MTVIHPDHKLKAMAFEDLFIKDSGIYYFLNYQQHPSDYPENYEGPRPDQEVHYLLQKLKEKAEHSDEFSHDHDGVKYRVSIIPAQKERIFVLRKSLKGIPDLDDFLDIHYFKQDLITAGGLPGLIISSGPTGSGKTSFISSLLKTLIETYGGNAVTIESPPEHLLEGTYEKGECYQMSTTEAEFPNGLRKILRYRPRYIYIGELRTKEAAMTAIQAGLTGHTVLTTIHGASHATALMNLAIMASPTGQTEIWKPIAESLSALTVMKRHPHCVEPSAEAMIIPALANAEGARSKIRLGLVEQLADDLHLAKAQAGWVPHHF